MQGATLAFWGAGASVGRVGYFGQHIGDFEVQRASCPHHLACDIGRQDVSDPGQFRILDWAEHVVEHLQVPACCELADLGGNVWR